MKRILFLCVLFIISLICVACTSNDTANKDVVLPDDIPEFIQLSDFANIDWERKAVEFGDRGIIGNENKSGVIGVEAPSLDVQKWMWHLWEIEKPSETKLTIVGFHRETETVHQILTTGWMIGLEGENNGADAHTPSSVKIPKTGEWAILLYTNDSLFDILVFDINE